jgi:hypothetical protein
MVAIGMLGGTVAASPPPPPPEFIDEIAKQMVATPSVDSFDSYAGLFANNLVVTLDGKRVATTKAGWLGLERLHLGKVDRRVVGYAEGRDTILVKDQYDDRSDAHCPESSCVFDPRYSMRAVQYQIGPDHLVHAIRILQSGPVLQKP